MITQHNKPPSHQMDSRVIKKPHARGLRYLQPSQWILRQECCSREYQIRLFPDQSSEKNNLLVPRLQDDQPNTFTSWYQERCQICTAIEVTRQRSRISKHSLEESSSLSKATNPGKIKRNKYWIPWSRSIKKSLLTIIGQDGVTLRYVIIESEAPY